MNNIIETNTLAVAPVGADNIQNTNVDSGFATTDSTVAEAPAKVAKAKGGPIGRPRTNLTKEVVFLLLADGSYKRRGKGKPAHDSKAFVYRVPWDYKGDTLPEDSAFVRNEVIKDTRKPKIAAPAETATSTVNPVVPSSADMLPLVV